MLAMLGAGAVVAAGAGVATTAAGADTAAIGEKANGGAEAIGSRAVVRAVAPASARVAGGTRVRLSGSGLAGVRTVQVGSASVPVESASAGRVVFVTPPAVGFRSGRTAVTLHDRSRQVAATALAYAALDGTDRQLQYVLRYWKRYNPAFAPLGSTDCVDFTSQSLLVRGWKQQGAWRHAADVYRSGPAWISSTAFRDFMAAHPELGSPLTDAQRSRVRLGDVVQFDWDRSGDRDHTGVVTRITRSGGRIRIGFAGHTQDSDYRDVDAAITKDHPGGRAHYWRLA